MTPPRVALLLHILAHYRQPIFSVLLEDAPDRPAYEIYASEVPVNTVRVLTKNDVRQTPLHDKWHVIRNTRIGGTWLWQHRMVGRLLGGRHDVLIFMGNPYVLSTWLVALGARLRGKKVLMWTHGLRKPETGIKARVRLAFYGLSDGLLLYGQRAVQLLEPRLGPRVRFYVVNNSLDYRRHAVLRAQFEREGVASLRRSLGLPPEDTVITTVGRLVAGKRLSQLVDAAARLRADGRRIYVVLIGDGPEAARLKAQVQRAGLEDSVRLVGACYEEAEIGRYFAASDLSVVPGDLGLSGIHALAYGCPVITHDNFNTHKPEIEAIVSGVTGDTFREDDVHDLAATIAKWSDRLAAEDQKAQARSACIRMIETSYTPEYQREVIDRAVRECMTPRSGAASPARL